MGHYDCTIFGKKIKIIIIIKSIQSVLHMVKYPNIIMGYFTKLFAIVQFIKSKGKP